MNRVSIKRNEGFQGDLPIVQPITLLPTLSVVDLLRRTQEQRPWLTTREEAAEWLLADMARQTVRQAR